MIVASTQLEDAFQIDIEPIKDQRGFFFARSWCRVAVAARGLDAEIAQESV
jgi:dTDP-4-dehydrorhamnose 3,5-epimerase-like enzyme